MQTDSLASHPMRPVFILGPHKAGTSLLRHLLDGGKGITTFPFESHFAAAMGHPILYPIRKQKGWEHSPDRFIEFTCSLVADYNESNEGTTDINLFNRFDESIFRDAINSISDQDQPKELFLSYLNASLKSLGEEAADNEIVVEKSVEHGECAPALLNYFPDARFIHIVRNPYSNLVSLRKFKGDSSRYPSLPELLISLRKSAESLVVNKHVLSNDRFLVIRYEDLLLSPDETMRLVASFIDVEFTEVLLRPTHLGKDWVGNSTRGAEMQGVSSSAMDKWRDEIQPIERSLVYRSFHGLLNEYYDFPSSDAALSTWRKAKGEKLKTYARNRLFKIFADIMS